MSKEFNNEKNENYSGGGWQSPYANSQSENNGQNYSTQSMNQDSNPNDTTYHFTREQQYDGKWQSPYAEQKMHDSGSSSNYAQHVQNQTHNDTTYHYSKPQYNDKQNESKQEASFYNPYNPFVNQQNNSVKEVPKKKDKGMKAFISIIVSVLAVAIIGVTTAIVLDKKGFFGKSTPNSNSSNSIALNLKEAKEDEDTLSASEVYKKVEKSIVGVVTNSSGSELSEATGQGSGIIMSEDGYIVTNAHVLGNTKSCKVTVVMNADDSKEYEAKIVGLDTLTDIAVLKIDATGLTPAEFGNSDQAAVGSPVLVLGNPGGLDFANSLTRGIVSAVNRRITATGTVKFIQTDAAINQGNSGGALLDMYGRVIGITSNKIAGGTFEGMGFAIPSNTVKQVVDELTANGYVSGRGALGMKYKVFTAYAAQMYGVPRGIIVGEIWNESNLTAAGVKVGDIITSINDQEVYDMETISKAMTNAAPGDKVKLSVYRRGNSYRMFNNNSETFTVEVQLIEDKG